MKLVKPIKPNIETVPGVAFGIAFTVLPDQYLNVTINYVTFVILVVCFQINITLFGLKFKRK